MCIALCLSVASYMTLQILESKTSHQIPQEMMAEDLESQEALPDVHLLKQLMHKTLEFMLMVPRF
jgi:hypothetical protein